MARARKYLIPGVGGKQYQAIKIPVGGMLKHTLIEQLHEVRNFGCYIGDAMRRKSFVMLEQVHVVTFVYITLEELGLLGDIQTWRILDAGMLKRWSDANLSDGWQLGIGHISYGPSVGLLNIPLKRLETLWIATKRLHGESNGSDLVYLRRDATGKQWIDCAWAEDNQTWDPEDMFLFPAEQKRRR